jgi:2-keto-4-pentenoate hydratase/2-oxohepta-3-ene-1,7-dioic acid hydratase in catechol pathway
MDASTDQMLYKVDEMLSVISDYLTIEPGDMVMTGSPSGSAGIQGWLIVIEDPDQNRVRLYTLETHGPELKPDEANEWLKNWRCCSRGGRRCLVSAEI